MLSGVRCWLKRLTGARVWKLRVFGALPLDWFGTEEAARDVLKMGVAVRIKKNSVGLPWWRSG